MKFALNLSSRFPSDSRPSGVLPVLGSWLSDLPPPSTPLLPLREGMRTAIPRGGSGGVGINSVLVFGGAMAMHGHPRTIDGVGRRTEACLCGGARAPTQAQPPRCLSLQFTSPSVRFGVVTFISGSKVLHTLAPWWLALNVFQKNYGKKSPFFFGARWGRRRKVLHTLAPW